MLRDRYRQLLTAFIDDELSSRQRRHVARLLKRSAEARQMLQQLREDAQALRRLPRPAPPPDLTGPVLRTIAERRLAPGRRRLAPAPAANLWMMPLVSWTIAAGVLLFLGAASYLYFAASLPRSAKQEMAQKQTGISTPTVTPEERGSPLVQDEGPQTEPRDRSRHKTSRPSAVKAPEIIQTHRANSAAKVPDKSPSPPKEETALTDRLEMFHFDQAADILPVVVQVHDLDKLSARRRFQIELQKDSAFRMELPCPNGAKAFERVQKAAQTLHYELIIDKKPADRGKSKWRTNYLLYFEDVTPDEFIRFVQQIGVEDSKSAAGNAAEVAIDRLVLTRMSTQHHKELAAILGIDPPATTTTRQAEQVGTGQGGRPRPEAGKSIAKSPEHYVLVLAHNPVRPAPGSEEIKRFLQNRKPARNGTIRVLLMMRS